MADQNTQFYAILTNVGAAKQANADALGVPWKITQMGVGDANGTEPTPNATQTRLINEWRRAPLNQLKVDEKNNAIIVAEQVIPAEVGGKWIREIALYDADGDMVAVANCPPTYKPLLNQGSGRTQVVRMNLLVSSSSNVELKIDPAVVLATREYVDSRISEEINRLDSKQSVRAATTGNIPLAGLQVIDGVQLVAGDRVLVKNQASPKDNGIWIVAVGVWVRAKDADASVEVTSGMIVSVEQGLMLADTIWQLVTDGVIVLGTTDLAFQNVTFGFAPLKSPEFLGSPTAPTPPLFDSSQRLSTTEFAQRCQGSYADSVSYIGNTILTPADVGRMVAVGGLAATTVTLPDAIAVPIGSVISVLVSTPVSLTVQAKVGQSVISLSGVAGPFSLPATSMGVFRRLNDGSGWIMEGGDAALKYSPLFESLLAGNGHCKMPSGWIIQCGQGLAMPNDGSDGNSAGVDTYITFPRAFPNVCAAVVATHFGHKASLSVIVRNISTTRFTAETPDPNGSQVVRYLAMGY